MIERKLLSADEALGIWIYSIASGSATFKQQVRRTLDGTNFMTFVAHESVKDIDGHRLNVLEAICRTSHSRPWARRLRLGMPPLDAGAHRI